MFKKIFFQHFKIMIFYVIAQPPQAPAYGYNIFVKIISFSNVPFLLKSQ